MAKRKFGKAPHTADTTAVEGVRGFAGLPRAVTESLAWRTSSLIARAILVELTARMDGKNNGAIHASYAELAASLNRRNQAAIGPAIAELIERGLLDLSAESIWQERKAREYRLTFVNTTDAIGRPIRATNDYVRWTPTTKKIGATDAVAEGAKSVTPFVAGKIAAATNAVADANGKPPFLSEEAATNGVVPILKPYMGSEKEAGYSHSTPSNARGLIGGEPVEDQFPTYPACERCGEPFKPADRGQPKRFCSERCRKAAEAQRRHERQRAAA